MKPQDAWRRGASYLDEATENLTFDEFAWAFEEAWRGVAWTLNALRARPASNVDVGPKGELPRRGTLHDLLASLRNRPRAVQVVERLEAARASLGDTDDLAAVEGLGPDLVEQLVFDTWTLHNECGERLAVTDDRLGDRLLLTDVSPGRVGSPVIRRRTALKLLAATSVVPLTACEKVEQDNRPGAAAKSPEATANRADEPAQVERDRDGRLVEITIAAGAYDGHTPPPPPPSSWASQPDSDLAIWSIRLEAGAQFQLPAVSPGTKRSLYLHDGDGVRIAGVDVPNARRVEVTDHGQLSLRGGPAEAELLLLQGRPIDEPVAKRGPFVMNTQEEIRQAYTDYRRTQFGGWPWSTNDPVHVRTRGRFARHIDGSFEEPT